MQRPELARDPDIPGDAIAAASLILMHEHADGAPEYLFVRRTSSMIFAAGAYVFPGGRVDPSDYRDGVLANPADWAARVAALRETGEETGIAIDTPIDALVPFARWMPRHEKVLRRFDTRFYLVRSVGRQPPRADGIEASHAFWATASDILARCAAGDGRAIFPTRRLLERLAGFAGFEDARKEAERLPQQIISPWTERRDDGDWLCIPDDAGYPVREELIDTAMRY